MEGGRRTGGAIYVGSKYSLSDPGGFRKGQPPSPALDSPERSWRSRKLRLVATYRQSLQTANATACPRPLQQQDAVAAVAATLSYQSRGIQVEILIQRSGAGAHRDRNSAR